MVHRLSSRDLRLSRTHLTWLRTAWTFITLAIGIGVLEPLGAHAFARPPLWSGGYIAIGLGLTVVVSGVLVWLAPRVALATAVACAVVGVAWSGQQALWWAAGLTAAVMLGFVLVRDSRSRPRGDVVVPATGVPFGESWAATPTLHRWLGVAGVAAVVVAGLVGLAIHQMETRAAARFEAGASLVSVPVSAIEEDEDGYQYLTVILDGVDREIESPSNDDVAVGDQVDVLTDGSRAVLVGAGQDNPAWLLGLVAAVPMAAAAVCGRYVAPHRRRARLVAQGAPGVTVRVVCNGEIALVLPTDADWPALELTHLDGLADRDRVAEAAVDADAWEPGGDDEEPADLPTPATAMELAHWADDIHHEITAQEIESLTIEEKTLAEAVVGPDTNGAEPFILVGSWAHGSTVALARATGQVWLAEVEEPQPFKGRRRFLRAIKPGQPGWEVDEAAPTTVQQNLALWALRHGRWTRWVAALVVAAVGALVVPFMLTEAWGDWFNNIRLLLAVLVVVTGPFWATSWSWGEFSRFRQGFGWYGLLLDDVVGPARVDLIAPGSHAVGVRLRAPEDMLSIDPAVVRPGATTEAAAAELQSWLGAGPQGARGGRRPTPALVATVLMLMAWAAQLLPLALGS